MEKLESRKTEVKWILILWVVTLAWHLIEKWMGWTSDKIEVHALYTNIYDVVLLVVLGIGIYDVKLKTTGEWNWMKGFTSGMMIGGGLAMLSPVTQYFVHTFISPEFFPNIIELAVAKGYLTQEAAEAQFNLMAYIFQNFIGTLIIITIFSALLGLVFKSKKNRA